MDTERRFVPIEFRADSRVLSGTAVAYGDEARLPWGRERFEPGAFGDVRSLDVVLNVGHDETRAVARTGGGGLTLDDDAQRLAVHAELPETREGDDVLTLVRGKVLRALSVEFRAVTERMDKGVRVVEEARLSGIAVVARGAYPASEVAARMARQGPPRRYWY